MQQFFLESCTLIRVPVTDDDPFLLFKSGGNDMRGDSGVSNRT